MGAQRLNEAARIAVNVEESHLRASGMAPRSPVELDRRAQRLAREREAEGTERLEALTDLLSLFKQAVKSDTKAVMLERRQEELKQKLAVTATDELQRELEAVQTELFAVATYSVRMDDEFEDALEDFQKLIR